MIVVDTSAVCAILLDEPERDLFNKKIVQADICLMSAASLLEMRMVLYGRFGDKATPGVDALLYNASMRIEPVSQHHSDLAFDAFRRYGKGSGHKAGLNFGDCLAYALAKDYGVPLLFKGDDFGHTDIVAA